MNCPSCGYCSHCGRGNYARPYSPFAPFASYPSQASYGGGLGAVTNTGQISSWDKSFQHAQDVVNFGPQMGKKESP